MRLYSAFFFCNDTATTEIYTLSLHDALPISVPGAMRLLAPARKNLSKTNGRSLGGMPTPVSVIRVTTFRWARSEEHTSELQSRQYLVCRLLLEKKKKNTGVSISITSHLKTKE